jgi:chromate reductase
MALQILGIAGSLRKASTNKRLLLVAQEVLPPTMHLTIHDLIDLPFYNGDVEAQGYPESVVTLAEAIRSADGLLIACPEYNYAMTAVLKNAIDWVSRFKDNPFKGKPIAIMGTGGRYGTVRAQMQLQVVLNSLEAYILPGLQVAFQRAYERFDKEGNLLDESIRVEVTELVYRFEEWIQRVGRKNA